MLFYAIDYVVCGQGCSAITSIPLSVGLALALMQIPLIERSLLYALGAMVWALVTLALEVAVLLWCAFTLEFVGAGPLEERIWVVLQSISLCVMFFASMSAYARRPFTLGKMPVL